jgi:hypothetical protein
MHLVVGMMLVQECIFITTIQQLVSVAEQGSSASARLEAAVAKNAPKDFLAQAVQMQNAKDAQ